MQIANNIPPKPAAAAPAPPTSAAATGATRSARSGANKAIPRKAQRRLQRQRAQHHASPPKTRHLQPGTARRALHRNLAHLQHSLSDPQLPQNQRQLLEQSVATLELTLRNHRALRTNMAAVILG